MMEKLWARRKRLAVAGIALVGVLLGWSATQEAQWLKTALDFLKALGGD